jgi:plastocyanin
MPFPLTQEGIPVAARSRFTLFLLLAGLALFSVPVVEATRAAAEEPAEATVELVALRAVPDRVEITTGTTVTWINREPLDYPLLGGAHQVVADDGSWASPKIAPGTRWSRRFDQPGTVKWHSASHPTAAGEIVVTGEPILDRPVEQEVAITEDNPDDPTTWGFRPADLVIEAGTTVVWRNNGKNSHTVSADNGSFESGDIAPGATWKHTFDRPGAFAYHCTPHPWMKASIRVVVPGSEAPPPPVPQHEGHGSAPASRTASATPERIGRGPVRHEVSIVEPDPAKPFEWGFEPVTLDIKGGDTVVWRNTGSAQHSVTSDTFDSRLIDPGAEWERTFAATGVFDYRCTPHPWMKGVVRVSELDAEALPPLVVARSAPGGGSAVSQRAEEAARIGEGPSVTRRSSWSRTSPRRWSGASIRPPSKPGSATPSSGATPGRSPTPSPPTAAPSTPARSAPGKPSSAPSTSPAPTPTTAPPTPG